MCVSPVSRRLSDGGGARISRECVHVRGGGRSRHRLEILQYETAFNTFIVFKIVHWYF